MIHRCIVIVLLVLSTALSVPAQSRIEGRWSIGAKGGVCLSKVNFTPSVPQTLLPGMTMGVTARYVEEKHFGIIAELNLEQRGWKETFEGYDYAYQRRLTYLHLPLMTHIFFGNYRVRGFFNAGPEVALLIGRKTTANFDYTQTDFPIANRHTEQFTLDVKRTFDYGITAGIGVEVNLARRHALVLEGRFYYGLGDIFDNHKSDPFSGSSSMAILATLGYVYTL